MLTLLTAKSTQMLVRAIPIFALGPCTALKALNWRSRALTATGPLGRERSLRTIALLAREANGATFTICRRTLTSKPTWPVVSLLSHLLS